jgi:hypothetical protein
MGHSTGYTDVDTVLAELVARVGGMLGCTARRYVSRRLAGDRRFAEHSSDIDVLVVTEDVLCAASIPAARDRVEGDGCALGASGAGREVDAVERSSPRLVER